MKLYTKSRLFLICVIAACLMLPHNLAAGDDNLMIITEDYPPLNYVENNELKGPAVDIVRAIKDRIGTGAKIKVYPWARAYKYLETKKNTALFSTTRTKSREGHFKWVGPIAEKKIGLFALKDRSIKLKTLEDAKEYLIGVQRGGVGMQYLTEQGYENFDASTTASANFKKLLKGRNDLWFSSNATVAGNAKKLNADLTAFELVLEVENTFMAIAFNKDTPDDVIARWQSAYEGLVKQGVIKDIFHRHGLEILYPTKFGN